MSGSGAISFLQLRRGMPWWERGLSGAERKRDSHCRGISPLLSHWLKHNGTVQQIDALDPGPENSLLAQEIGQHKSITLRLDPRYIAHDLLPLAITANIHSS